MTNELELERLQKMWEARPYEGTSRERRAWENGFHDAIDAAGITYHDSRTIFGGDFYDAATRPKDVADAVALIPTGKEGES